MPLLLKKSHLTINHFGLKDFMAFIETFINTPNHDNITLEIDELNQSNPEYSNALAYKDSSKYSCYIHYWDQKNDFKTEMFDTRIQKPKNTYISHVSTTNLLCLTHPNEKACDMSPLLNLLKSNNLLQKEFSEYILSKLSASKYPIMNEYKDLICYALQQCNFVQNGNLVYNKYSYFKDLFKIYKEQS